MRARMTRLTWMDSMGVRHRLVERLYDYGGYAYRAYCDNRDAHGTIPLVEKDEVITCLYCVAKVHSRSPTTRF